MGRPKFEILLDMLTETEAIAHESGLNIFFFFFLYSMFPNIIAGLFSI